MASEYVLTKFVNSNASGNPCGCLPRTSSNCSFADGLTRRDRTSADEGYAPAAG